ncbi:MAG TPA: recombination protein O N-terminal domain-containing protein [Victivallales bacterium]|nr:recombination protein O N-terminal domain-containing protein [Victivallales bacterium]
MKNHCVDLLILKKTPYGDTSLIVNCLSGKLGRVDLLIKGARRLEKRKFPEIDIFNEINAYFSESKSGTVHTLSKSELTKSRIEIASFPKNLVIAMNCAKFILSNTHFNMHSERLYRSTNVMLRDFCSGIADDAWKLFIRLIYLEEQGFLPNYDTEKSSASFAKMIRDILEYSDGGANKHPKLSEAYKGKLEKWIAGICQTHSLSDNF